MGEVNLVGRLATVEEMTMKILGLAICFAIMMGAFLQNRVAPLFRLKRSLVCAWRSNWLFSYEK